MEGEVRVNIKPRQLYGSVTDTPTSQVGVRHDFVLTADRRTDLVGRSLVYVHPTISMTLPRDEAYMLVRTIRNPFWVPRESREHSPASECYEWFHQPMRNFRRPIKFDVVSGFVSMSYIFSDVWIFVIFMLPF
jgi:hypothetical protein